MISSFLRPLRPLCPVVYILPSPSFSLVHRVIHLLALVVHVLVEQVFLAVGSNAVHSFWTVIYRYIYFLDNLDIIS